MTKHRTTTSTRLWTRATRALGKLLEGMVSSPDDRRQAGRAWSDYPIFPPF
jgi:hypothetical protein